MDQINTIFNSLYDSIDLFLIIKIIIAYFFILRISLIIWVIKDITNRTSNIFYQFISIFIIVFWTPLSIVLYLIIRPARTNLEKVYGEIDDNLNLLSNISNDNCEKAWFTSNFLNTCPWCNYEIKDDFKACPNCWLSLKINCKKCNKEVKIDRNICPYCEEKLKDEEKEILQKEDDENINETKKEKKKKS